MCPVSVSILLLHVICTKIHNKNYIYNYMYIYSFFILCTEIHDARMQIQFSSSCPLRRGELSYLAPLGSENISAPYFKQCFFQGGGYYPPD